MFRMALSLGVVAVLLIVAGCTMCCHPYDYCGPVYDDCGQSCSPCYRAGSVLSGCASEPTMESGGVAHRTASGQAVARAPAERHRSGNRPVQGQSLARVPAPRQPPISSKPADVPNSERIVSVTERIVGPSLTSDDASRAATGSSTPAKAPADQGWTARRPTRPAGL